MEFTSEKEDIKQRLRPGSHFAEDVLAKFDKQPF